MTLLLVLLLALQGRPAAPFSDPNDPDNPGDKQEYRGSLIVPKHGKVTIPFIPAFAREPSCSFSGATIPGERPHVSTEFVIIKAKPGKRLTYECHGVKRARDTEDTAKATAVSVVRQGIHSAEVRPFLLAEVFTCGAG